MVMINEDKIFSSTPIQHLQNNNFVLSNESSGKIKI